MKERPSRKCLGVRPGKAEGREERRERGREGGKEREKGREGRLVLSSLPTITTTCNLSSPPEGRRIRRRIGRSATNELRGHSGPLACNT